MLRIVHNFEEVTTQSKTKIFELWEKTDKNYLRNVTFMDEIICKKFIPIGQHFSPVTGKAVDFSFNIYQKHVFRQRKRNFSTWD